MSATRTAPPALEAERLCFRYDGLPVLEDVNLTIEPLDFAGVVGPNGGGKTTLLKLALGLLQPTSGSIRLLGDLPEVTRQRVGYVPQGFQFDARFPVTVREVVLMGRLGGRPQLGPFRRPERRAADRALERVGLGGLGGRPFAELSGGQRQRVLVARALATEPEMLMLDEPTANVDPAVEREIYDLLRDLNESMTIILVCHDLSFVSKLVKRVVCVRCRVTIHPTFDISEVTGETLERMFGSDVRLVQHDNLCQLEDGA